MTAPRMQRDRRRRLAAAAVEASEAQATAAAALAHRDRLILAAFQAGATFRQVRDATGVSVAQLQRIRRAP